MFKNKKRKEELTFSESMMLETLEEAKKAILDGKTFIIEDVIVVLQREYERYCTKKGA